MEVDAAVLKRSFDRPQQRIILRRNRFRRVARQFRFKAFGKAVNEAFKLAHLADEGIPALGKLILEGGLDLFAARLDAGHARGIFLIGQLKRVKPVRAVCSADDMGKEEVELTKQRGGHSAKGDRNRDAQACIGNKPEAERATQGNVQDEENSGHIAGLPRLLRSLTISPKMLTNW